MDCPGMLGDWLLGVGAGSGVVVLFVLEVGCQGEIGLDCLKV